MGDIDSDAGQERPVSVIRVAHAWEAGGDCYAVSG